jgi:hypothetical protein
MVVNCSLGLYVLGLKMSVLSTSIWHSQMYKNLNIYDKRLGAVICTEDVLTTFPLRGVSV